MIKISKNKNYVFDFIYYSAEVYLDLEGACQSLSLRYLYNELQRKEEGYCYYIMQGYVT